MVNLVADTIVEPAEIKIDWSREVFANIGLLSLRFALLELSLQRCIIFWQLYQFVLEHPEITQTEFSLERDKRRRFQSEVRHPAFIVGALILNA